MGVCVCVCGGQEQFQEMYEMYEETPEHRRLQIAHHIGEVGSQCKGMGWLITRQFLDGGAWVVMKSQTGRLMRGWMQPLPKA